MKNKAYYRAGILFIAAIIIAFWGINYLKGKDILTSEQPFYSLYEKIGGLTKSSPVTINGFQVGQVRHIRLSENHKGWIEVKFSISNKSIRIPKGSAARIYSTDLMGTKGIALDFSDSDQLLNSGDTLKGSIEGDIRDQVNAQMLPLKLKAEDLMSSMDSVLGSLRIVFSEDNRANLAESFSNVNSALGNLESASRFLDEYIRDESKKVTYLLSNVDSLSRSLKDQTSELQGFISNMNRFSDTLANIELGETIRSIQRVLDELHQLTLTVASGKGSLGQLIYSDSLYTALIATNTSLNRLIEDIRINPGRYVSMSLSNKNKTIYSLSDTELARSLAGEGQSDYYICFLQSSSLLPADDPTLKGIPEKQFIQIGSIYYYYSYHSPRIDPCLKKLEKLRKSRPDAGIFCWINGQWTRLKM
jgi:phospholipid/cholesterol/gamma-HCH transport system substrate-binding protein